MDTEDFSTTYLKLFNDVPQSYFLQNSDSEVGLGDTFTTEPIFTEIDASDWPTEGFPVLLNGSMLTDEAECNGDNKDIILVGDCNENDKDTPPVDQFPTIKSNISAKNEVLSKSLFVSNDALLNSRAIDESDDSSGAVNFPMIRDRLLGQKNEAEAETVPMQEESIGNNDSQVIEFINLDGSVTAVRRLNKDTNEMRQAEKIKERDLEPIEVNLDHFVAIVTANKCKVCSFLCETTDAIINHLKYEHPDVFFQNDEDNIKKDPISVLTSSNMASPLSSKRQKHTIFLCSVCKSGYTDREELKQHMIDSHEFQTISQVDEKSTKSKKDEVDETAEDANLKEGNEISMRTKSSLLLKLQQRALKKVKCSVKGCDLRFARDELRARHEECHINQQKKQFMCPVCKEKFSIWRICSMHLWKCHKIDLGLLTCPMCNKFKSNSPVRVLTHMKIHSEERPYLCAECGKSFKTLSQMQTHQATHRDTEDAPVWLHPKKCSICERSFSNSKSLKKHIATVHEKFKPFMCTICGYKAARKDMVDLHMRQHTGDKPHHCQYCSYKSRDHSCLRKHLMKHMGSVKKYVCPHCEYTAIQVSNFKNHLVKKHSGATGGIYSCTYCPYSTVNEVSYCCHMKQHDVSAEKSNKKLRNVTEGVEENNDSKSVYYIKVGNLTLQLEDDDTQNSFSNYCPDETIDMGGYTIPADQEIQQISITEQATDSTF